MSPAARSAAKKLMEYFIVVARIYDRSFAAGPVWNLTDGLIPGDARVEMDAKRAAGYFSTEPPPDAEQLAGTRGRNL